MDKSYVVVLIDLNRQQTFQHFAARNDAIAFALEAIDGSNLDRADIYEVLGAADPNAAIAAVKRGAAELIGSAARRGYSD